MTSKFARILSALSLCALCFLVLGPAVSAQSDTDTKIRLMSEALQARDSGDLELAKAKLEELLELVPNDASVQRILNRVERMIEERESAPAAPAGPAVRSEQERADSLRSEAEFLARLETERIEAAMASARSMRALASSQAQSGDFNQALGTIGRALASLEPSPLTQTLLEELRRDERDILRRRAESQASGMSAVEASALTAREASPDFVKLQEQIEVLALRGRSQFFAGDLDGAESTFKQIEALDPNSAMAKNFLLRIARERESMSYLNKMKTREQLLQEVSSAWQRPSIYQERPFAQADESGGQPLLEKLNRIVIPNVNFTEVELNKVVNTLSAVSEEFDIDGAGRRGVNLVLLDPGRLNPTVNITLRNLSLKRILDFIVDSVGFQYDVESDAVVIRPGGELSNLTAEVFPVSRSTVIRMTGVGDSRSTRIGDDPFAVGEPQNAATTGIAKDAQTIRNFLQQAGVDFAGVEGSTLAYDGSAMIVSQSPRNLERIRNILNRYTDVKQVEIEAKFLEVQEGALEELGFDWVFGERGTPSTGNKYDLSMRNLATAASPTVNASDILISREITEGQGDDAVTRIVTTTEPLSPPSFPGTNLLGEGAQAITTILGSIDGLSYDVAIRALSQKTGSDLLSAPKVTVLSGNQAEINVSQEFRYPTRYSDTESDVGTSSGDNNSSAGVTITPGTPQDFETRNVGVELSVTPIVEEDDYSITLEMNPRVTEFEGFVEYGGPSIAISGGTTVKTPSGFYQPIFSVREVLTKVTIWDGATVVMGGLTREDVITVNDKVPFLGDIPLVGRLFRSEGESSTKRNLLIFVTANLVSPGGSPKRQSLRGVQPGALFQNPTLVTPGGSESRSQ